MSGENAKNNRPWYIFDQGNVTGPFDEAEIKKFIDIGEKPDAKVWRKGQAEWAPLKSWLKDHGWGNTWYVCSGGFNSGPFGIEDVGRKLLHQELPMSTQLWTMGLKNWVGVYDVNELVKMMGIPVRRHVRVPFEGVVRVGGLLSSMFKEQSARANCLSVGGMSLSGVKRLAEGSKVSLTIISDSFSEPIKARGQIVYQFEDRAGVKFLDMPTRSAEAVSEYVGAFEIPKLNI